jgi:hypothetical protein
MDNNKGNGKSGPEDLENKGKKIVWSFIIVLCVELVSIILFAFFKCSVYLLVLSGCIIIGGTALVAGLLLGFLFGIPKTAEGQIHVDNSSSIKLNRIDYRANTNLEQISDWLTKILVGVSLTQVTTIGPNLQRLSDYLSVSIGAGIDNSGYIWSLLLYNAISGFIFGYVMTRMYFPFILRISDVLKDKLLENKVDTLENKINDLGDSLESKVNVLDNRIEESNKVLPYSSAMLNALYKPDGYIKAIEIGETYIAKNGEPKHANFWVYLAAAYGQKYKQGKSKDDREKALYAVKKGLEVGESTAKPILQYIWDPNLHAGSEDDDLEVFYTDDDFKKLLGE